MKCTIDKLLTPAAMALSLLSAAHWMVVIVILRQAAAN
jgi:hypothetical protein